MLYRRKLILNLLHVFERKLSSLELQKYIFLLTRQQIKPSYDFVPHLKGGYSFLLQADSKALLNSCMLQKDNLGWWVDEAIEVPAIKPEDLALVLDLKKQFCQHDENSLLQTVYKAHPYYATRSQIASSVFAHDEWLAITNTEPVKQPKGFFTSGYEGLSIDAFIDRLLRQGIQHVCDVRKNAFSMKYGFSKGLLKQYLNEVDISYSHHPHLGIDSKLRKNTAETQDWNGLFDNYEAHICSLGADLTQEVFQLLNKYDRIVLVCFEENHADCHRGRLSKVLKKSLPSEYPVVHL